MNQLGKANTFNKFIYINLFFFKNKYEHLIINNSK